MTIYIVYPFLRDSTEEYENLLTIFSEKGYEILNKQFEIPDLQKVKNLQSFNLGNDLLLISLADIVYFAKNWDRDYDCKILFRLCRRYNIKITTLIE